MNIIIDNPYRQLGIYSTSPQREIVSNQGKMKAFLKVGKSVTFPLDLEGYLPAISRTEDSVAEANAKLTLPIDRLKYGQFWFSKVTPLDEVAFGKLMVGDIESAKEVWNKRESISSLQNLMLCSFIMGDIHKGIRYAESIYPAYSNDFVKMILGDDATVTDEHLEEYFLDTLISEYNISDFIKYLNNREWKEYVKNKTIQPIINKILKDIDTAKSSEKKGGNARLQSGKVLMRETKSNLAELYKLLPKDDLRLQMIVDKLGLTILQCSIDYYNDSEAPNSAIVAMELQKYALSIVIGKMAKDRCKENCNILDKIIAELPPEEVYSEDRAIHEELKKFVKQPNMIEHSITLLKNTKPYLQRIKTKLGSNNDYYLKISTQIVGNALQNLIEEVNFIQKTVVSFMKEEASSLHPEDRAFALKTLMTKTVEEAWEATRIMDTFDMEYDFKRNRYDTQRAALKKLCESIGVATSPFGLSSSYGSSSNDDIDWGCIILILLMIGFTIWCIYNAGNF